MKEHFSFSTNTLWQSALSVKRLFPCDLWMSVSKTEEVWQIMGGFRLLASDNVNSNNLPIKIRNCVENEAEGLVTASTDRI